MGPKVKGDAVAEVPVPVDPTDAERRGTPRVLVHLEVDCASEENYLFAYITDISTTGIFVRTTTPELPGTRLHLRLSAEDASSLEVEGDVIWINPFRPGAPDNLHPGMGIRFVKLDSAVRERLFELIGRFAYLPPA